jgi:hypothetical protein
MEGINRRFVAAAAMILMGICAAHADDLVNQVVLVKDASVASTPLPLDSNQQSGVTFSVSAAQAGMYTITVTDVQTPVPLGALSVAVSTATQSIAQITGAAGGSKSQTVMLAAGTYTVQPLATAGTGSDGTFQPGLLSVVVAPQGGTQSFWQDEWAVSAGAQAVSAGQSVLSQEFTVSDGGTYTLILTDQNFPATLATLQVIIFPHGMTTAVSGSQLLHAGTAPVDLPAGHYDLFAYAQAGSSAAGLYSVSIVGGSMGDSLAFAATEPVGQQPAPTRIAVPAGGTMSLMVNDLQFPTALTAGSLKLLAVEGATVLQPTSGPGTYTFAVTTGTVQVFATAQPDATGGQGAYAVYAMEGTQTLSDIAVPVVDASHYGYSLVPPAPLAAGSYQLGVIDYGLPQPLGGLSAAVVQQGALIAGSKIQSTSDTVTFAAGAGAGGILVFPVLAVAGDDSLLGIVLSAADSGAVVFNTTNGVGALFTSTNVTIAAPGNYVVQAADLAFPAAMRNLAVVVTSGQAIAGSIYGGGTIPFTAHAAGTYVINVFTELANGQHYGLYGVEASPAATATLTASPATITSGGSTTLMWSSSNDSSCTPGSSWTTSQATSGSQLVTAVTTPTTFTMTCTGDGGPVTATAFVQVSTAAPHSGGGGAMSPATLLALAATWLYRVRRRCSVAV